MKIEIDPCRDGYGKEVGGQPEALEDVLVVDLLEAAINRRISGIVGSPETAAEGDGPVDTAVRVDRVARELRASMMRDTVLSLEQEQQEIGEVCAKGFRLVCVRPRGASCVAYFQRKEG